MKICIVMPIHDKPSPHCMVSMCGFTAEATRQGHELKFDPLIACSGLPNGRNVMLEDAWEWGADVAMSIDDDMLFKPEHVSQVCHMAVETGAIVSGVYSYKDGSGRTIGYPVKPTNEQGVLQEMELVGMGFCAIPRIALRRMREAYPAVYRLHDGSEHGVHAFYEMKIVSGDGRDRFEHFRGEDKVFCDKWRAIGGKVWLDRAVQVGHVGMHVYA